MKKIVLSISLTTLIVGVFAQTLGFKQILPLPPAPQNITDFEEVQEGSIAFADVDSDGDQDVLITGAYNSGYRTAKLYTNDGNGNFSFITINPFDRVSNSSIAFADVDSDGDQDVLITGLNASNQRIAKLYTNDGNGNFSHVTGTPFDGVQDGSIAFVDGDSDGDQDVIITGQNTSNQRIAKLYSNDGNGNFSLVTSTSFTGVMNSSIAFADVDSDGDQDILITGQNTSNQILTKLYTNDGSGNFVFVTGTPFDGALQGSIAFADVDSDGDQDVLITGLNASFQHIAKLYTNDGIGNFSFVTGTPFEGIQNGSIAFADGDSDGDLDVLITGQNTSNQRIAKLYTNDGIGNFSLVTGTPFDGVRSSSIAFADIDSDSDQDILITGENTFNQHTTKLYINDGNGNFSLVTGTSFDGVHNGSIAFADIDNDSDQDVLITGVNASNQPIAKLYTNDGNGNFSIITNTPFDGVQYSSIAFADVDSDGDQDILITGVNPGQLIAKLYANDGSGNFSLITNTPFDGVQYSSIAFADVDSDGDQDVLITGLNASFQHIAKLYTNDGIGNFSFVTGTPFDGVQYSSIAFADVDSDGDQDVLITGRNTSNQRIAKLYTNDGNGNFALDTSTSFTGVFESSIAFADVDNDGDQDVLITGRNTSNQPIAKLYANYGNGNFGLVYYTPFAGVYDSSIAFADVDSDGDQDVLITGSAAQNHLNVRFYTNDGNGNFSTVYSTPFDKVQYSSIAFADVDSDGDQDILLTGQNRSYQRVAKLYRTTVCNGQITGTDTQIACDTYTWIDGNTYTSSNNTATHTLTNTVGCDSVVTLDLTLTYSNSITDTQVACDTYTWIDGNTYTSPNNTATHTLTNIAGCDSIVTLALTINSNVGTDIQTACHTFSWIDGNTYTSSNNSATHALTNVAGCDSIVTLALTINSNVGTDIQTACHTFSWIDGNTYTSSNNTATHALTNVAGCDSIVTLALTINSNVGTDIQMACNTFSWIDGNTYTSSNNTATHTLTNVAGCDSVVTLNLTINSSTSGVDTKAACHAFTWIDGNTYTSSNNTATDTLTNITGCDSVVTLNLTINSITSSIDTQTTCDTYIWLDGNTYTSSNNTATHILTNSAGCDSLITLDLTITAIDVSVTETDPSMISNEVSAVYHWLDCNNSYTPIAGETNQNFTANTNGDYAVEVSKSNCIDTSACVTISTVSINKNNQNEFITIYPNPSKGFFNINLSNLEKVTINIYDLQGKLVYNAREINSEIYQLYLEVVDGIYNLDVISEGESYRFKLVKG